jgi:hypothetical protein
MTPKSSFFNLIAFFLVITWFGSRFPYSCLLFRMCNTYAEIGLFVLTSLICSWFRVSIYLPVWPKYDLLHVSHCNLRMLLEFILLRDILSYNWLYIVIPILKAMLKSTFFNKLVT